MAIPWCASSSAQWESSFSGRGRCRATTATATFGITGLQSRHRFSLFLPGAAPHDPGMPKPLSNPIIVALDVPTVEKAMALIEEVAPAVGAFKIGSELFTSAGPDIVRRVRASGAAVFLDLKFHDIPNTVAKSVAAATRLDVQMLTIHAGGGPEMIRAAEASAQETARSLGHPAPLVLGVTVLTSMDADELNAVGISGTPGRQVERLAGLAASCGLRGLVCSPLELAMLRQLLPSSMTTARRRTDSTLADWQLLTAQIPTRFRQQNVLRSGTRLRRVFTCLASSLRSPAGSCF